MAKKSPLVIDITSIFGANGDEVSENSLEFLGEQKPYIKNITLLHRSDEYAAAKDAQKKIVENDIISAKSVAFVTIPTSDEINVVNFKNCVKQIEKSAGISGKKYFEGLVVVAEENTRSMFENVGFESHVIEVLNPQERNDNGFQELASAIQTHSNNVTNKNGPALFLD
jgi:thioredoxin reductase